MEKYFLLQGFLLSITKKVFLFATTKSIAIKKTNTKNQNMAYKSGHCTPKVGLEVYLAILKVQVAIFWVCTYIWSISVYTTSIEDTDCVFPECRLQLDASLNHAVCQVKSGHLQFLINTNRLPPCPTGTTAVASLSRKKWFSTQIITETKHGNMAKQTERSTNTIFNSRHLFIQQRTNVNKSYP